MRAAGIHHQPDHESGYDAIMAGDGVAIPPPHHSKARHRWRNKKSYLLLTGLCVGAIWCYQVFLSSGLTATDTPTDVLATAEVMSGRDHVRKSRASLQQERERCEAAFGERRLYDDGDDKEDYLPPLLYSFAGAGSTWTRLLIEYATGIHTGNVYKSKKLDDALPGSSHCDNRVILIKAHPPHINIDCSKEEIVRKCKTNGGIHAFKRYLFLYRDPWDAIWSTFQLWVTKSHTGQLYKSQIRKDQLEERMQYQSDNYVLTMLHYKQLEDTIPPEDMLKVRFEDLRDHEKQVDTLGSIVRFLGVEVNRDRLQCAFILGDRPDTHRPAPTTETAHLVASKYQVLRPLACAMWARFGAYAAEYGYTMLKGAEGDCPGWTTAMTAIARP